MKKSTEYFKLASKQGDKDALYMMAYKYFEGKGVKRKIDKAISFFFKSAQKENPEAFFHLGTIYYEGVGKEVPKDLSLSIKLFKRASELGHLDSLYNYKLLSSLHQDTISSSSLKVTSQNYQNKNEKEEKRNIFFFFFSLLILI